MPKKTKPRELWAICTREPGTYILGEVNYRIAEELKQGWVDDKICLYEPAIMRREGSKVSFERADVFAGVMFVDQDGQLGVGPLAEPYLSHYRKFLTIPLGPPAPPAEPSKTS